MTSNIDSFPRQYARTQRLTLGEPRNISVSPDGLRVWFLRSRGGSDSVNCLWLLDVASGTETLIADPHILLGAGDTDDLPPEELARRERMREGASGITSYTLDHHATKFVCALGGRMFTGDIDTQQVREIHVPNSAFDPRMDPTGSLISFVSGRAICVSDIQGTTSNIADPTDLGESETVSWGSAEFIAAEEMDRQRGNWWNTDGSKIAVCRVDDEPIQTWYIADPSHPDRQPTKVRYPAAGTNNAHVTLSVFSPEATQRTDISWDTETYPYLADVSWISVRHLLMTVQSRDQRHLVVYQADTTTGILHERHHEYGEHWVDLVPGSPTQLDDERLVFVADRDGCKRLLVQGLAVTRADLNVRSITSVRSNEVIFLANEIEHPETLTAWQWNDNSLTRLTSVDGVHSISSGGDTHVIRKSSLGMGRTTTTVLVRDIEIVITSLAEQSLVMPKATFIRAGVKRIPCALFLPRDISASPKLPVLMDPYGGPGHQRVIDSYTAHCTSQWFADQGFAVLVVDGAGTPGLGTEWERSIHLDLASTVLEDQVTALLTIAADYPVMDLSRVAIRGWSFGGYLAALAVLRRPDIFHSAVAGAPVTDWRLYDTHYTERFLGNPNTDASPYEMTSLLNDAHTLTRPLLLIHGLADDNVVAAHTLQLSSALLGNGKAHEVLPLSGVTHMTPQAIVTENLLLHQLDFLRRSLAN